MDDQADRARSPKIDRGAGHGVGGVTAEPVVDAVACPPTAPAH
jgi:hypothetical protein